MKKSEVEPTSLVGEERILQTTPPDPPDSRATRSLDWWGWIDLINQDKIRLD